ncbi:MAG: winged helix-turn-helix domain-containing protein [Candidatus Levybacteria bacterium]|nr:winged helix-turn-helix domain-containing protein [Candidatus Levybacteria bacterium]
MESLKYVPTDAAGLHAEKEPVDPEELYARFLNACHLELAVLAFLRLPRDLRGKTTYELATEVDPMSNASSKTDRSTQIANYFRCVIEPVAQFVTFTMEGRYTLTSLGARMQGVAYHLINEVTQLNEREATNIALPQILSKTAQAQSRKGEELESIPAQRRGPYLAARIIEKLDLLKENETITMVQLSQSIGCTRGTVRRQIDRLKEAGIVSSKSASPEKKGEFKYSLRKEASLPEHIKSKNFSNDDARLALDYIRQRLWEDTSALFDAASMTQTLYPLYAKQRELEGKTPALESTFLHHISTILSLLHKQHILDRQFPLGERAESSLTPMGRKVAKILADIYDACKNPNTAESMQERYYVSFPQFVQKYAQLLLARQKEQGKTQLPIKERLQPLFALLLDHSEGVRSRDIDKLIGREMTALLLQLRDEYIVVQYWSNPRGKRSQRGSASMYKLSPKALEILSRDPQTTYEELRERLLPLY